MIELVKVRVLLFLILTMILLSCSASFETKKDGLFNGQIGLQAWSLRYHFRKDISGTLDRIAAMGIKEMEVGIGSGELPAKEYKKLCDERGISIPSFGATFEDLETDPHGVLLNAKTLGAKYIMCPKISHKKGKFNLGNADHAIKVFNDVGELFAKRV